MDAIKSILHVKGSQPYTAGEFESNKLCYEAQEHDFIFNNCSSSLIHFFMFTPKEAATF